MSSIIRTACYCILVCGCQIVRADLVAHWALDEGQGEAFRELVSGNDGFLPDDSEIEWIDDGPPGIQDVSVNFVGDLGPSYIETEFEGIGGDAARTITLWVKADPQPFNTAMVAWGATEPTQKWHFRMNQGTNSLRTEYMGGQNFAETDMADFEWHFVASVYPEGGEGADIMHYLDAEFDFQLGGASTEIDTAVGPGAFPVHIGWAAGHPDRYFVGQIADVRIYDEALEEDQLAAIMRGEDRAIPGDYDGDSALTAADIDLLSAAVRDGKTDSIYDLNQDGLVDSGDRDEWVQVLKNTFFGDADLNDEFNSSDLVIVFQAGEYEDAIDNNSGWATGDWNGDTEFGSGDLVRAFQGGGYEVGPRVPPVAVPEPSSQLMLLCGFTLWAWKRRRPNRLGANR